MLRLKNIRIERKQAEADYFLENSDECGHILVDLETRKISQLDELEGYWFAYPAHARQALLRMADEHDERKEALVMWY